MLSRISHAKNRMEGPDDVREELESDAIARLRGSTRAISRRSRTPARSTSTICCSRRWSSSIRRPPVRERYARKFQFVMVDEYQDTNRPQYLLIKQLASLHRNLCRRRRSRSVDLQMARRRPPQHPRLRDRFSRVGRSSGSSATTARRRSFSTRRRRSSRNNRNRKEKTLWTDRKGGAKIVVLPRR